jgi:hypothetical protein
MTAVLERLRVAEQRAQDAELRAQEAENLISATVVLSEAGFTADDADDPECSRLFHEIVQLPDEQAMRRHLREAASAPTDGKTYTADTRELLAKEGKALPDGSYRIKDEGDLKNAIQAIGRAKDPAAAKAHIIKRAKALSATHLLPEDWEGSTRESDLEESVKLQTLGIPTVDGGPRRLLEAASAADLAARGIPILDASPAASPQAAELRGIPLLPEAPATRRVRLTESESGTVLSRIS